MLSLIDRLPKTREQTHEATDEQLREWLFEINGHYHPSMRTAMVRIDFELDERQEEKIKMKGHQND